MLCVCEFVFILLYKYFLKESLMFLFLFSVHFFSIMVCMQYRGVFNMSEYNRFCLLFLSLFFFRRVFILLYTAIDICIR